MSKLSRARREQAARLEAGEDTMRRLLGHHAEPPLPGRATMVRSLASAVVDAVRDRGRLAPPELVEARRAACRSGAGLPPDQMKDGHCDQYRPSDDRCGGAGCGCYVSSKSKLLSSRCPLNRWPKAPESPRAAL